MHSGRKQVYSRVGIASKSIYFHFLALSISMSIESFPVRNLKWLYTELHKSTRRFTAIFPVGYLKKFLFKVQDLQFNMNPYTFYNNLLISDFSEVFFHHLNTRSKIPDSAEIVKDSSLKIFYSKYFPHVYLHQTF